MVSAALAGAAYAQEGEPLRVGPTVHLDPVGYPSAAYEPRATETVYDNASNTFSNAIATLAHCSEVIEDVSFSPGPWADYSSRLLTELTYAIGCRTANFQPADILLIFWNRPDVNFAGWNGPGTSMVNPAATPLGVVRVAINFTVEQNYAYSLVTSLSGMPGGGISIPGSAVCVQQAWVDTGFTPASYADLSAGIKQGCAADSTYCLVMATASDAGNGGNCAIVGTTAPDYGQDISTASMCPNIGWFAGSATVATSGDVERRTFIGAAQQLGLLLTLRGNVVPTCPYCQGPISPADGVSTLARTLPGGSRVDWMQLVLAGDATDAALHFLDIDTETSGVPVALGLYDDQGTLLATDNVVRGSTGHSQLSFGVGRRAQAVAGSGQQYDGRDGQLTASHSYYLAGATQDSEFTDGYIVTPGGGPTGPYTLRFNTNVHGAALAPSVPPLVNGVSYGSVDPLAGGQVLGSASTLQRREVVWSTFTLEHSADEDHFLEVDFSRLSGTAPLMAYVFDSVGNIRGFASGSPPMLRFGRAPLYPSGTIGTGVYYLAAALAPADDLRQIDVSQRWHVRSSAGAPITVGADLRFGTSVCCREDFNGDGDSGTDADIEAFFACVAGNCCPLCPPNADFNCDGDAGTDADIESFFRVLAQQGC